MPGRAAPPNDSTTGGGGLQKPRQPVEDAADNPLKVRNSVSAIPAAARQTNATATDDELFGVLRSGLTAARRQV
jgi:hypothetical protein